MYTCVLVEKLLSPVDRPVAMSKIKDATKSNGKLFARRLQSRVSRDSYWVVMATTNRRRQPQMQGLQTVTSTLIGEQRISGRPRLGRPRHKA